MIGLAILVHKLTVELKGKLQDGIPVSALYVKNALANIFQALKQTIRPQTSFAVCAEKIDARIEQASDEGKRQI